MDNHSVSDSMIVFENSQGFEIRGTLLRLTRHLVAFEIYSPTVILQMSEVLSNFKINVAGRLAFSGRAVVNNLVNTGTILVCEATLDESWLDVHFFAPVQWEEKLRSNFDDFSAVTQNAFKVRPEFKVVVADMQILLMDLRRWLEQVELGIRSQPTGDRHKLEQDAIAELQKPILPLLGALFERFETVCGQIETDLQPAHRTYVKQQLHPIVLCAPFMYRTFQKPLGYAGDYEMVNMMLRNISEGSSLFAKVLNNFFLCTPPVVAHRNRITYLIDHLIAETCRIMQLGRNVKIFNLGCGPAQEIQAFLIQHEISAKAEFTLMDFNEETLAYAEQVMNGLKAKYNRTTPIHLVKKAVAQFIKEAAKPTSNLASASYDFVYCAGLFDYLPEHVCQKLMKIFYDMLAPGGLLVATNVDESNPARNWMEYSVDWNLVYRNYKKMAALVPSAAPPDAYSIKAEASGVNIFIEVRKPVDA